MTDQDPRHAAEDTGDRDLAAVERGELPPLRSFNAFASFDDGDDARGLILALERAGIDGRYLSAVELSDEVPTGTIRSTDLSAERDATVEEDNAALHQIGVEGAKGGALGAVLGAMGGTVVALAIPGIGTAMGAGILAVTAGGAAAGAGVGTFAGAVANTPATRSWERALVDIKRGQIVVGVHADDVEVFDTAMHLIADSSPRQVRRLDRDGKVL